jgi:hypothetical protein
MGLYTKCTDYEKATYRGGEKTLSVSKVENKTNEYTTMNCFAPGLEINPANGEQLIVQKIDGSNSFMVTIGGVNQNFEPDTERGERKLYSVSEDGADMMAWIKLKNDGALEIKSKDDKYINTIDKDGNYHIENAKVKIDISKDGDIITDNGAGKIYIKPSGDIVFNDGTKTAVRFEDLKTGFDTLRGELNTFIGVFTSHVHPVTVDPVTGIGATSSPATPGVPATATIDASKSPKIQLP